LQFTPSTNTGSIVVSVPAQTPPGAYFIRTFNSEGCSAPRFLIVSPHPESAETEPNDAASAPQRIASLPITLNGRLEKNGDVDSFSIPIAPGQSIVAWLEAYTLMSPLDPVLRLVDSRGVQVAWNHDDGRSLDPLLTWTRPPGSAPAETFVLQVFGFVYPAGSDVRFSGSPSSVYRLHVEGGPVVHHTLPLGVQRGVRTPLLLRGWNLPPEPEKPFDFDGTTLPPGTATTPLNLPGTRTLLDLPVGDGPEKREAEPNHTAAEANPLPIPGAVTGDLIRPGDEDRYRFDAKKGEALRILLQSSSLGFPLDAWIRVENSAGKELARNDDATGADPQLDWTAPEDGSYGIIVGNLLQRGGPDAWYRLSLSRPQPTLQATVAENAFTVEPGKTNEIKVTLARLNGWDAPLRFNMRGLPEGVRLEAGEAGSKETQASLKLIAATNAPAFAGPIRIEASTTQPDRTYPVVMSLISAGENNGVPQGYRRLVRESIADLWLTVPTPPKPAEKK
jgi:hypothetical protein